MGRSSILSYLSSLEGRGIRTDLGVIREVLEAMGRPHEAYPSVLIAGTNGKGSTAAMMEAILRAAGLRTGLYTSPHLADPRERICCHGAMISPDDFVRCLEQVRAATDRLTYFEFLTAAAFVHFAEQGVEIAVLEVGMGGRYDATNVAKGKMAVITNVSYDHQAYLGTTLARIAAEKAGIIRAGGVCLTAVRQRSAWKVIEGVCREKAATLMRLGGEISCRAMAEGRFAYRGPMWTLREMRCALRGAHQVRNAALAVGAAEMLVREGFPIREEAVRRGLEAVRWPGRLEVVARDPLVVLDGAHNPAGMATLRRALRECFTFRRLLVVFGALQDKDAGAM
ncbi:MAG: bifunctional folylpolyglutamate synthase/dihydrofolate synthase, partial [Syntrophales bacterium]|nr:bifunctional folylpolyglutamate synthase/dihydrofolate synthase [Syntrophales bacterium]